MTKKSRIILLFSITVLALGVFTMTAQADCYRPSLLTKVFGVSPAFATHKIPCEPGGGGSSIPAAVKNMVPECDWDDPGSIELKIGQILRINNTCASSMYVQVYDSVDDNWGFTVPKGGKFDYKCNQYKTLEFLLGPIIPGTSFILTCST